MQGNSITSTSAPQLNDVQSSFESAHTTSRVENLLARIVSNAWVSAALIFVVTRGIALAGAYSGVSYITSLEPARNKGWLAELALMWDAAWYANIAANFYHYDPGAPGGTDVAF
ncbi:MAG TPA: hypothetical protein VLQ48_00500, partial [Chloroflexia bacterium]|nr:hypothetical protein [Chloroflexia bacterium]